MSSNRHSRGTSADVLSVVDAITGRRSVRGFLDIPVSRETLEEILRIASWAPSGTNIQPWKVRVLTGAAKQRISDSVLRERQKGLAEPAAEYLYPVASIEPYVARRRKVGWDLYKILGVARGDYAATRNEIDQNFRFYGAPVGMIFTLDRRIGLGSYIELGAFLQSVMLAARYFGLDTCPQAAWASYHAIIRTELGLADEEMVMCGMAMGVIDTARPANQLRTEREPVNVFATFIVD